jgi:superoxide dismutase, Cu-Zn family
MSRIALLSAAAAALALAACATARDEDHDDAPPMQGPVVAGTSADARSPGGAILARANVEQAGDSLRVRVEAAGLGAGAYGAHIHATGRCDAPSFNSAGAHWNPTGVKHGKDNPAGMHKGDLPNLLVGADGRGSFEYTIPNATLSGRGPNVLLDADGAAIVIHASADDFRTDPSGNSGARIACGVLG